MHIGIDVDFIFSFNTDMLKGLRLIAKIEKSLAGRINSKSHA
jgi:hypothetical protein